MSAQIIRALRQRADQLDAESQVILDSKSLEEAQAATGREAVRDVGWLRALAEEFRALAAAAEQPPTTLREAMDRGPL